MANRSIARTYATVLDGLVAELGAATPVGLLDEEATAARVGAWFTGRWGSAAVATVNARLD